MYLPTIKNGRPASSYLIGANLAIVFTDCESLGMIRYTHVMFVFKPGERVPCYAVAAEMNAMMADGGEKGLFLGVFPGNGHMNYGLSEEWRDLDKFTARALALASAHFGVEEPPQPLAKATDTAN